MIWFSIAVLAVLTMLFANAYDVTGKLRYWWGIMISGVTQYILLMIEEFIYD